VQRADSTIKRREGCKAEIGEHGGLASEAIADRQSFAQSIKCVLFRRLAKGWNTGRRLRDKGSGTESRM
jgi:hypothetical protein